jgi:hypothetical protein
MISGKKRALGRDMADKSKEFARRGSKVYI